MATEQELADLQASNAARVQRLAQQGAQLQTPGNPEWCWYCARHDPEHDSDCTAEKRAASTPPAKLNGSR